MAAKIIVTGSVAGQLKPFFEKIRKLHAKTPFSFLLISGDLFSQPGQSSNDDEDDDDEGEDIVKSLLNSDLDIPLPTYFGLGHHALPPAVAERIASADGEVCPNLYFLGKRSTTKTSDGIRIVTLGGLPDPNVTAGLSKDQHLPFHTESDAKALHGANTADILLTGSWPAGVRKNSTATFPSEQDEPLSEPCIADLCSGLQPRYHFSMSSDLFYERQPFYHNPKESSPDERRVTRFISMASFNAPTKAKWLYAFSLDPKASAPSTLPPMTTTSPFTPSRKRALPSQNDSFARFSGHTNGHHPAKGRRRKYQQKGPLGPNQCFFCLSNENVSQHMITSIGEESYLGTARGPLTLTEDVEPLDFPGHMLIIPFSHSPSLSLVSEAEARAKTFKEMSRFRTTLQSMLEAKGGGKLGAVTWELSWQRGVHFHWQFLPIERSLVEKGLVEAAFKVQAETNQYSEVERRKIGDGLGEGDFFRAWVWMPKLDEKDANDKEGDTEMADGESKAEMETELVLRIDPEVRFDVQFGRHVMAKLLEIPERLDWKECMQSEEDETKDAEAFKKAFETWDFTKEE